MPVTITRATAPRTVPASFTLDELKTMPLPYGTYAVLYVGCSRDIPQADEEKRTPNVLVIRASTSTPGNNVLFLSGRDVIETLDENTYRRFVKAEGPAANITLNITN